MALSRQVVDLVRLHVAQELPQTSRVGQVGKVKKEAVLRFVQIAVDVVNPAGIEATGTALQAVYFIALLQKEFRKVRAILARNAGN